MCSAYQLGKRKNGELPVRASRDAVEKFSQLPEEARLTRPTMAAPVLDAEGRLEVMRWGFERPFNRALVNAREDKLEGGMWRDAMRTKRCVVPVTAYYEWSGPQGNKRTHRFSQVADEWIWIAAIWEESPELGKCFSMITTEATGVVRGVHDRMPAVLSARELEGFLDGELREFRPAEGLLQVRDAVNPLTGRKRGPVQQELF